MRDEMAGDEDEGMGEAQEIIDEEELGYLQRMKEQKRIYRDCFDQLKTIKGEIFYITSSVDQLKQQLVNQFEDWFVATFEIEEDQPSVSRQV